MTMVKQKTTSNSIKKSSKNKENCLKIIQHGKTFGKKNGAKQKVDNNS